MIPRIPGLDKGLPYTPHRNHHPSTSLHSLFKAFHKLPEFSEKVAHNFSESCPILAFRFRRSEKLETRQKLLLSGSDAKVQQKQDF